MLYICPSQEYLHIYLNEFISAKSQWVIVEQRTVERLVLFCFFEVYFMIICICK